MSELTKPRPLHWPRHNCLIDCVFTSGLSFPSRALMEKQACWQACCMSTVTAKRSACFTAQYCLTWHVRRQAAIPGPDAGGLAIQALLTRELSRMLAAPMMVVSCRCFPMISLSSPTLLPHQQTPLGRKNVLILHNGAMCFSRSFPQKVSCCHIGTPAHPPQMDLPLPAKSLVHRH